MESTFIDRIMLFTDNYLWEKKGIWFPDDSFMWVWHSKGA